MWSRKRIEIGWLDLGFGLLQVLTPHSRHGAEEKVCAAWANATNLLPTYTERSGFDLLIQALDLPAGSEVLVSAVTIEGMVKILRHHGLIPVPIDLDPADMSPRLDLAERLVSERTRGLLVAHLFGTKLPMAEIVRFARRHGLQVWEDCAQSFAGEPYSGHPGSNVIMHSFGPIKSATALGGGLIQVNDPVVLERMQRIQATYPTQTRLHYLKRLLKYALANAISSPWVLAMVLMLAGLSRVRRDELLSQLFRNLASQEFFTAIRKKPSTPLLRMMARRITSSTSHEFTRRGEHGLQLTRLLSGCYESPGTAAAEHTFWVCPLLVPNDVHESETDSIHGRHDPREPLLDWLDAHGFDATTQSQLRVIQPNEGPAELLTDPLEIPSARAEQTSLDSRRGLGEPCGGEAIGLADSPCSQIKQASIPSCAEQLCAEIVFVPCYSEMPESEILRLADVLQTYWHSNRTKAK